MSREYRDPDWLEDRYHGDGLTQREIAEECDVAPVTIRRWMKRHGIETREIAGEHHGLFGKERSEETRKKIAETLEGRKFSDETIERMSTAAQGKQTPIGVREKISESLTGIKRPIETRKKMSRSTAGDQNPNWKGGNYAHEWYGPGWAHIRESISDRDRVCQHCGHDGAETRLEVHHIIPIREFREGDEGTIEDANHESNLILLCERCHGRAEHDLIDIEPVESELESDAPESSQE